MHHTMQLILVVLLSVLVALPTWSILADGDLNPLSGKTFTQVRALNHTRELLRRVHRKDLREAGREDWGFARVDHAGLDSGGVGGWGIRV